MTSYSNNGYNTNSDDKGNLIIKPIDLKKKIDNGEDVFILDVRSKIEHDMWSLSYDRYSQTLLIPVEMVLSTDSLKQLPKDKEIVTFCAHGYRSAMAAQALSQLGYNVKTVEGGMASWNDLYDIAEVKLNLSMPLKIWQIRRISKGCMSYLIASLQDNTATVIDATCGLDTAINDIIQEYGLKIIRAIDTHMHADHLSGSSKLAKKTGAELCFSSYEGYEFSHSKSNDYAKPRFIGDGEKLEIGGGIFLHAIRTAGHTDGSLSFKLEFNTIEKNEQGTKYAARNNYKEIQPGYPYPICLFTGDTIFVNGVGRPDLRNKSEEFTQKLYETYTKQIFNFHDETIILPAHYSSNFEHEKPIVTTLKSIKNKLEPITRSEKDFKQYVMSNIPPQPLNYKQIALINKNMISCDMVQQNELEAGPNSCGIQT